MHACHRGTPAGSGIHGRCWATVANKRVPHGDWVHQAMHSAQVMLAVWPRPSRVALARGRGANPGSPVVTPMDVAQCAFIVCMTVAANMQSSIGFSCTRRSPNTLRFVAPLATPLPAVTTLAGRSVGNGPIRGRTHRDIAIGAAESVTTNALGSTRRSVGATRRYALAERRRGRIQVGAVGIQAYTAGCRRVTGGDSIRDGGAH